MTDDDLSALDVEARRWPRLPVEVWTCPACRLGPTLAVQVCGVAWAICDMCRLRDHRLADISLASPAQTAAEVEAVFAILAACDAVDDVSSPALVRPLLREQVFVMAAPDEQNPILNAALRAHQRGLDLAAANAPKPPRAPTSDELDAWRETLQSEPPAAQVVRARLARWYGDHSVFSEWRIGDQWLNGTTCSQRLLAGDTLDTYLKAEGGGRNTPKDRR
jgi:hypothetical protein